MGGASSRDTRREVGVGGGTPGGRARRQARGVPAGLLGGIPAHRLRRDDRHICSRVPLLRRPRPPGRRPCPLGHRGHRRRGRRRLLLALGQDRSPAVASRVLAGERPRRRGVADRSLLLRRRGRQPLRLLPRLPGPERGGGPAQSGRGVVRRRHHLGDRRPRRERLERDVRGGASRRPGGSRARCRRTGHVDDDRAEQAAGGGEQAPTAAPARRRDRRPDRLPEPGRLRPTSQRGGRPLRPLPHSLQPGALRRRPPQVLQRHVRPRRRRHRAGRAGCHPPFPLPAVGRRPVSAATSSPSSCRRRALPRPRRQRDASPAR